MLLTFEFGSRSGSTFALALFCMIFVALACGIARNLRHYVIGISRRTSGFLAALLAVTLIASLYTSSLGGFYEVELQNDKVALRYLQPGSQIVLLKNEVSAVRPVPAFKGLWRLGVETRDGAYYESTAANRDVVQEAAGRLAGVLSH